VARFVMPYRIARGELPPLITYDDETARREAIKFGVSAVRGKICVWPLRHVLVGGIVSDYTTFDAQEIALLATVDPLHCIDQDIPDVQPVIKDPAPDLNVLTNIQLIELGAKYEVFVNRKWKRDQMIEYLTSKLGDKVTS
jgi:hypothetical protein